MFSPINFRGVACVLYTTSVLCGCGDLIIRDDGQVTLGLEDCEGVAFTIIVNQAGKPSSTHTAVRVEDGELEVDVRESGFDFDNPISVEVTAVGSGAEDCGIAFNQVLEFNGTAEPEGFRDHKISLGDFQPR